MQITIDGREFIVEQGNAQRALTEANRVVVEHVLDKSQRARREIKRRMPVRTGAARASWGSVPAGPPADAGDGIWQVLDRGWSIRQGSKREYIEYLNQGSSTQAPAGFLDVEEGLAQNDLEDELGDALVRLFSGGSVTSRLHNLSSMIGED